MQGPLCPCGARASQVGGRAIYPHRKDLDHLRFWLCAECGRYVGSHKATGAPLGVPADKKTRDERSKVHAVFDLIWKNSRGDRRDNRRRAYKWLADSLGITKEECHIGNFDFATCVLAQAVCLQINYDDVLRMREYDPDPEATSFIDQNQLRDEEE